MHFKNVLSLYLALFSSTASMAADPDAFNRTVKSGTSAPLTLLDRLQIFATFLGNPNRFKGISVGTAYLLNGADISDQDLLMFAETSKKGTSAIAELTSAGAFRVGKVSTNEVPWLNDESICDFRQMQLSSQSSGKCAEAVKLWL
jgi:hypothetical protein